MLGQYLHITINTVMSYMGISRPLMTDAVRSCKVLRDRSGGHLYVRLCADTAEELLRSQMQPLSANGLAKLPADLPVLPVASRPAVCIP